MTKAMLVSNLVTKLKAANEAYRNTDTLLMSDEEYDRGIAELRRLDPNNAFLGIIGPPGKTILPTPMASLDKILDSESLERWKKRVAADTYIISEKLDGISCLYVNNGKISMYLRGDGVKGVDISGLVDLIKLPQLGPCIVRGELILPREHTPAGSIGRSLVNGWVHRMGAELAAVRFVAYELIQPVMSRHDQFNWLKKFELPWYRIVAAAGLKSGYLEQVLQSRRKESQYATDGIVVASAGVPAGVAADADATLKNPKDAIAFKMSLDDQKAETVVTAIEWNVSRQGMLIPTILIEPVVIGEANISRLSGHNAALIHREKLGPGARIIIRRSGDVIPTLDTVLEACAEGNMPTVSWAWDSNNTHALAEGTSAASALLHALQTLEIDGVGPGLVDKLVEAGLDTLKKLVDAESLVAAGPGRGPKLQAALRASLAKASCMKLMIASNMLPRGVGERKLRLLFEVEADPAKWTFEKCNINGWGSMGIQDLLKTVPAVLEWCKQFSPASPSAPAPVAASASPQKIVVFTGIRCKELPADWVMSDTITKKTTALVVADDYMTETSKTKKAKEYGVRLMRLSEFRALI
jgi:NAD-dependent DNA ligase